MLEIIGAGHGFTQLLRSNNDGRYAVETRFHDTHALKQNVRIRGSGMLEKGRVGLHDSEDIRFAFSIPSTFHYSNFKRRHSDVYKLLKSRDEAERIKGSKQLQLLHPEWCVMERS